MEFWSGKSLKKSRFPLGSYQCGSDSVYVQCGGKKGLIMPSKTIRQR